VLANNKEKSKSKRKQFSMATSRLQFSGFGEGKMFGSWHCFFKSKHQALNEKKWQSKANKILQTKLDNDEMMRLVYQKSCR
jgi:hypothetical protein